MQHPGRRMSRSPSLPHRVACPCQDADHPVVPGCVIGLADRVDALFEELAQDCIFRSKMPLVHDPPGSPSPEIEDEQAPAAVVPADLGACQVDGTVCLPGLLVGAEKRACLGKFFKNAAVTVELDLVRVNRYLCLLAGVLVAHQKSVLTPFFFYCVDQPKMAAALTALLAFERQSITSLNGSRL